MNPTEHIQVVTFQLAGLGPDAYRTHCETAAPAFAENPQHDASMAIAAAIGLKPTTTTICGERRWESELTSVAIRRTSRGDSRVE